MGCAFSAKSSTRGKLERESRSQPTTSRQASAKSGHAAPRKRAGLAAALAGVQPDRLVAAARSDRIRRPPVQIAGVAEFLARRGSELICHSVDLPLLLPLLIQSALWGACDLSSGVTSLRGSAVSSAPHGRWLPPLFDSQAARTSRSTVRLGSGAAGGDDAAVLQLVHAEALRGALDADGHQAGKDTTEDGVLQVGIGEIGARKVGL